MDDPVALLIFAAALVVAAGSPGPSIAALVGYPLKGLLASAPNVSMGYVNALAGLFNDPDFIQISAPVQPGNSGGPLLYTTGLVVVVVTSKLNWEAVKVTGDLPENVNFAVKSEVVLNFLNEKGIRSVSAEQSNPRALTDIAESSAEYVVSVDCMPVRK